MNYASYEDVLEILQGVAKKVPQGLMQGNTPVGTLTWQYYEMDDYLTCDGSIVNNASIQYPELLAFAQTHSLVTTDTSKTYLFQYDSVNDIMTLPDLMDMTIWGTSSVEKKEAGLPNIKGSFTTNATNITGSFFVDAIYNNKSIIDGSNTSYPICNFGFDASRSSSIYSDLVTTVQPPAVGLIPQIKYRNEESVFNTVTAGRFTATAPAYYQREQLFSTNKTTITIYPTWVNVDNIGYVLETSKTIDITNSSNWDDSQYVTASNRAGKDFYIYAVVNSTANIEPDFILSANSTIPTGYTANTSRKIGGFHCLCLSVGTISGHTLSGYVTGDILPASPWDLSFRAVSENEGMVYDSGLGLWSDIYLASWNGSNLVSVYNGVPVTGISSKAMHGIMMAEEFGKIGKFLPRYDDFIAVAKGTPEGSHISTGAPPAGAGGHIDLSSRRIISNSGLEDCCGVLWQWGSNHLETTPNMTYNSANYWVDGLYWIDNPVYNSTVDSVKRGSCLGLLRRLIFGGHYGGAVSYCSSRAVSCSVFGSQLHAAFGGRGFSRKR